MPQPTTIIAEVKAWSMSQLPLSEGNICTHMIDGYCYYDHPQSFWPNGERRIFYIKSISDFGDHLIVKNESGEAFKLKKLEERGRK